MNALPGFKGYREKELRRDADRILRDHLAARLDLQKKALNDAAAAATRSGALDAINDIETARKRLDRVSNRIRYADRGYAPLFAVLKIDEAALARVYAFDVALIEGIDAIAKAARGGGRRFGQGHDRGDRRPRCPPVRPRIRPSRHPVGDRDGVASRGHRALRRDGRGDRPPRAAQRLRRHQARRAAHRPGEPVGGLLPRRQGPRHLRVRPPHPDHAQPAAARQGDRPAFRRREVALPGPGLLHQPPDLQRPEVGHQGAARLP